MPHSVDQLTLNGAITLLSYLQRSKFSPAQIRAEAVVATLCEILSQLEDNFPGITKEYGWEKVATLMEQQNNTERYLDEDRVL